MEKAIAFLLLIVCLQTKAQSWVTIPDANFVSALQDIIPEALIGNQLDTASPIVAATYTLELDGHGISNLYGLQFFTSLTLLQCANNSLSTLPQLPETLIELYCNSNQLTSLPALPKSLLVLDCSSNQLSSLPTLPPTLKHLTCFRNKLTSLPELPRQLAEFICYGNKIICLPILPNSITTMDISGNPS